MQTVAASVILGDAYHMIGWDANQLETRQKQMARTALSLALQEVWESWWWQELMKCEQASGAAVYAAADTYAAGDVVYYPATKQFYQACQSTTGNEPATLSSPEASYETNSAYWADAKAEYSGEDYVVGVNDTNLEVGDIVRNPADGFYYQLYQFTEVNELTVSGSGVAACDGVYTSVGELNGKPYYQNADGVYLIWRVSGLDAYWAIKTDSCYYASYSDTATPDEATDWFSTDAVGNPAAGNEPVPTVEYVTTYVYGEPTDASNWRVLTAFTPEITTISGEVRGVGKHDLRNSNNSFEYDFERTLDGWRIPGWDTGVPWVWYRRPVPILTGDDYSSTATYTAAETITFD